MVLNATRMDESTKANSPSVICLQHDLDQVVSPLSMIDALTTRVVFGQTNDGMLVGVG